MNKTLLEVVKKLPKQLSEIELNEIETDVINSCNNSILTFINRECKAEVFHRTIIEEEMRFFKSFVKFNQQNGTAKQLEWISIQEFPNLAEYKSQMNSQQS